MKKWTILLLLLLAAGAYMMNHRAVSHGPGVMAPEDPIQTRTTAAPFSFRGFTVIPLADFDIQARVLGKKSYQSGTESQLSPWDIAFGWGRMSDESVLKDVDISQSNRFYYWKVRQFPIPRKEIETHSANMHLIPADDEIEDVLDDARTGNIMSIIGHLVRIEGPGNWLWKSSLTRSDTGHGPCEVIFVTAAEILE